jgi:molybdenum cofactor biosynthesis protein B
MSTTEQAKPSIRIFTVTISDTRTRETDESGRVLGELLREAGYSVMRHAIIKDEPTFIQDLVRNLSDENTADVIILTGGTGIAKRDNTFEALEAIFGKRMDGFGEAFRRLSWDEIGPRAILTRATAGVFNGALVFSLPGSTNAVKLGVTKLILPVLPHAMALAQGRVAHMQTLP